MRRYQLSHVSSKVYCSSSGHYGVDVAYNVYDATGRLVETEHCTYCPNDEGFWKKKSIVPGSRPKYLVNAIELTLRRKFQAGELRFYEYDKDGNRRWDNFRYHEDHHFAYQIREDHESLS